jgi:hypothetical protein
MIAFIASTAGCAGVSGAALSKPIKNIPTSCRGGGKNVSQMRVYLITYQVCE